MLPMCSACSLALARQWQKERVLFSRPTAGIRSMSECMVLLRETHALLNRPRYFRQTGKELRKAGRAASGVCTRLEPTGAKVGAERPGRRPRQVRPAGSAVPPLRVLANGDPRSCQARSTSLALDDSRLWLTTKRAPAGPSRLPLTAPHSCLHRGSPPARPRSP